MQRLITPEEAREIVRKAIEMGTMSYPGGGTEPPKYAPYVSTPIRRAKAKGIDVEEYRRMERERQQRRRNKQ